MYGNAIAVDNGFPSNSETYILMSGNAAKSLDKTVISQFERFLDYCNDNDIKVVCVSTPITPDAFKEAQVDRASEKLKELFDSYNIKYYDFNKTLMSVLPRDDSGYVDTEGHMYGELAVKYSGVLAKVLADDAEGNVNEEEYFYKSYEDMYETMKDDYEAATGLEWKSY